MPSIRDEVSFEKRAAEAHRIRVKYPNRIPVICEKAPRSDLPIIDKKKFLVPMNMLVGEFKYIIHKHINQCAQNSGLPLTHEKTIYLFVENTAPKAGALMQEVYDQHVSDDGFLYVEYSSENALGALPLQYYWNRSRRSTGGRYPSSSRGSTGSSGDDANTRYPTMSLRRENQGVYVKPV